MKRLSRFVAVVIVLGLALVAVGPTSAGGAMPKLEGPFDYGTTAGGQKVDEYILTNANGMEVKIITYGGTITSVKVPDRKKDMTPVALGFDNLADYETKSPYFGCITGRYANRIAKGMFTLDGTTYCLDANNGVNSLHGGAKGFDKVVWTVVQKIKEKGAVGIKLHYVSAEGEGWTGLGNSQPECVTAEKGYPGNLDTYVTYRLTNKNEIVMDYEATTDAKTIVNLTNHSYWNLSGEGEGDINDHMLMIDAGKFTPVDVTLIPTGIEPVTGVNAPFDFQEEKAISEGLRDYKNQQVLFGRGWDHNWVLNRSAGDTSMMLAARLRERVNGIVLEVWTDQPGIQFYSGNFLDGTISGTSHRAYRQGDGLALETQHYPDSPNHPAFPTTVLDVGDTYKTTTIFKFAVHHGLGPVWDD